MKKIILVSMVLLASACGGSPSGSEIKASPLVGTLPCESSVPFAVCEGVSYLNDNLRPQTVHNGVGINFEGTKISIFLQILDESQRQEQSALVELALLELHLAEGRVGVSSDGRYFYFIGSDGHTAWIEIRTFGQIGPGG